MSIPSGATSVTYFFNAQDENGEYFNDQREFSLAGETSIMSTQQTNDSIESIMDSYLESINTTYPVSGGYTVNASRSYKCAGVSGDTWPTA